MPPPLKWRNLCREIGPAGVCISSCLLCVHISDGLLSIPATGGKGVGGLDKDISEYDKVEGVVLWLTYLWLPGLSRQQI